MKNPLAVWRKKRKTKMMQDTKNRILNQRGPILDAFSESIKGARTCPLYMGGPCIGNLCELFQEYTSTTKEGKKMTYSVCNFNQTPRLIIESMDIQRHIIAELRATQKLLIALHEAKGGKDADKS